MKAKYIFYNGSINLLTRGMKDSYSSLSSYSFSYSSSSSSRFTYSRNDRLFFASSALSLGSKKDISSLSSNSKILVSPKNGDTRYSYLTSLLNTLNISTQKSGFIQNQDSQVEIEEFLMENISGYNLNSFNKSNIINDINKSYLGSVVYSFVDQRETMISKYVSNLLKIKGKSNTEKLLNEVFTNVDPIFIKNLIICQFLSILTFKDTDEEDKLSLLNATLQLGRKTINKYLYTVLLKIYKSKNNNIESFIYSKALSE